MLAQGTPLAAGAASPTPAMLTARAICSQLGSADDDKIGKIMGVVNRLGNAEINRTLLDPLRGRLASLRPSRPLRLSRLLFVPLDPLIVPPRNWRPDQSRLPRPALLPLTALVEERLGPQAAAISAAIEGKTTNDGDLITQVGETLWPLAASVFAGAQAAPGGSDPGVPASVFPPLAAALSTVLREASHIRRLCLRARTGLTEDDAALTISIMANLAGEPPEGAAMVTQLILLQVPQAAHILRQHVAASRNAADSVALHKAMARGIDESLTYLERDAELAKRIEEEPVAEVADRVRTIALFLKGLDDSSAGLPHRARIRALREDLGKASQVCFHKHLNEDIERPLTAGQRMLAADEQRRLEAHARDIRALETVARHLGDAEPFDRHLLQTADKGRAALASGTITPIRACRLVEILSGPDAAAALYRHSQKASSPVTA